MAKKEEKEVKKRYLGPWTVRFRCGGTVFVSMASNAEIGPLARRLHADGGKCTETLCGPAKFVQER